MKTRFSPLLVLLFAAQAPLAAAAPQRLSPAAEDQLRLRVDEDSVGRSRWPDFRDYREELRDFYESQGYALGWLRDSRPSPQASRLAELFATADAKDLVSEDYGGRAWLDRLARLKWRSAPAAESELVAIDLEFTTTAMRYVADRSVGRMSLAPFRFDAGDGQGSLRLSRFLRDRVEEALDVDAALDALDRPPRNPALTARCEPYLPGSRSLP
jgi:hypothetical protein